MQLVMLNVSDHDVRIKANGMASGSGRVYGILLGQQLGRQISISNSFELQVRESANGDVDIDEAFLTKKLDQCKPRLRPICFSWEYTEEYVRGYLTFRVEIVGSCEQDHPYFHASRLSSKQSVWRRQQRNFRPLPLLRLRKMLHMKDSTQKYLILCSQGSLLCPYRLFKRCPYCNPPMNFVSAMIMIQDWEKLMQDQNTYFADPHPKLKKTVHDCLYGVSSLKKTGCSYAQIHRPKLSHVELEQSTAQKVLA